MASIWKHPKSPYWMAKFRMDTGRITTRSTKEPAKHERRNAAQEIANEWERAAVKGRADELTRAVVLKTMDEILERTTGERLEVKKTKDFLTEWLAESGRSQGTKNRYSGVINGFVASLGERRANASVGSVTSLEIKRFRDSQIDQGKSASTANLALKILKAAFASAQALGLSLTNPAKGVDLLSDADAEERDLFTPEQVRDLMSVANDEWRGMILFGYHAGIRLCDAAKLTWENIELAARTLVFRASKTSGRKKGRKKDTPIFLHSDLTEYLEGLHAGDDPRAPLFPSLCGGKSGSEGGLSNAFTRLMGEAGVHIPKGIEKKGKGRRFSKLGFHSFRHTMASNWNNSGIASDVTREVTGHSTDAMYEVDPEIRARG